MIKKNKNIVAYLMAFSLPCAILIGVWTMLRLSPFGEFNLMVSDLGTQYLPFLDAFKRFFTEGGSSLYSFENGIGGPMESTIAYYLMSPFNFLVLPFSYEKMPIVVLAIITLKISFMGLSMYTYLDRHYKQSTIITQAFSLAYCFCGFVVVYLLNFMWLDVLILLPIVTLGIEKVWYERKHALYACSLFLSILTNYYLGYMVCLYAVLYSGFLYYLAYERSPANSFRVFFHRWRGFIITSLLAGLLTSFMLIPAILGMFETGKTSFHIVDFLPLPRFGLEILSQTALGTINYSLRLYHLPMIYSGIFIYLLCFLYFSLPIVPKRKKRAIGVFLIIMYLSFLFNLPNTIWHMFQSPAGFPYRNSFILSFLLIKVAYEAYLYLRLTFDKNIIKKHLVVSGIVFSVLLSIGQFWLNRANNASLVLSNRYFLISLGVIWLMVLLLQLILTKQNWLLSVVFVLFISLELGGNLWISMKDIPFGSQNQYEKTYNKQKEIITDLTSGHDYLFRINQEINGKQMGYNEINNGYNNSFMFGYDGISSYSSTLNSTVQSTLVNLGLYAKNERRFSYVDESQVANLLLNVQYTVSTKELPFKQLIEKKNGSFIYQNEEAIGSGLLVNQRLEKVTLETNDVLKNQESILQALMPLSNETYFKEVHSIQVEKDDNHYQLSAAAATDGMNYLYIPNLNWSDVNELKVNGETVKTDVYIATNQLYQLGYFKKGEAITIDLDFKKASDITTLSWASLDDERFRELINTQKERAVDLQKTTFGHLQTTVDVKDDNQLLYLSVPYDKNWLVKVDGKKVKPKKIMGDFMGIELDSGKHQVTLQYISKPLLIGIVISVFILMMIIMLNVFRGKRKQKR